MDINSKWKTTLLGMTVSISLLAGATSASAYTVTADDTMWKISQKNGVTLQQLIKANPQIKDPNNIWSGLYISVPTRPANFQNGVFPLKAGTYVPFDNNYAAERVWSPNGDAVRSHEGIDIFAPKGTPVYSATDGTISKIGWNEYGGWRVTIKSGENSFYYAHLNGYGYNLYAGAPIKRGQIIGYVGSTGYGPVGTEGKFESHLHFGMYTNTPWAAVSPYKLLKWWESQSK